MSRSLDENLEDVKQQQEIKRAYQDYQLRTLKIYIGETLNEMLRVKLETLEQIPTEDAVKMWDQYTGFKMALQDLHYRLFDELWMPEVDEKPIPEPPEEGMPF